ncbi:MAG: PAS domain S-box protein, partial [Desulfobacterales bacterium]|nr:PAS domain S-box protein [Desulfobacterales bacterium]
MNTKKTEPPGANILAIRALRQRLEGRNALLRREIDQRARAEKALTEALENVQHREEELATYNEELQAVNEELLSANEQLVTTQERLRASRRNYMDLYDFAPVGYCVFDEKGVIREANLTAARQLGVERGRLVKTKFYDHLADGDKDPFFLHLGCIFRGAPPRPLELGPLEKDGPPFYIQLESVLIEKDAGRSSRCMTTISDITAHKKAKMARQESEEKFRALVESSSDWIWEVNKEGVYTYASPRVASMLGYAPGEVVGKSPFDLMSPEEADRTAAFFKDASEKGEPIVALENVVLHADGRRVVLETSGVPFFDEAGRVAGYRG